MLNANDDDIHLENIVIGQILRNQIVTKVKVDVQEDSTSKYHIKKWITLQDGMILISEYWKEKSSNGGKKYESSEETLNPDLLPQPMKKDDSSARAKARELLLQRRRQSGSKSPSPTKQSKPKTTTTVIPVIPPPTVTETVTPGTEGSLEYILFDSHSSYTFDEGGKGRPVTVLPPSSSPSSTFNPSSSNNQTTKDMEETPITGVWATIPDTKNQESWVPMNVVIYPKLPKRDLDNSVPPFHGIVSVLKTATPDSYGNWKSTDLKFHPPRKDSNNNDDKDTDNDNDCYPIGVWIPDNLNASWPPKEEEDDTTTTTKRSVGKLKLPSSNKDEDDTPTGRSVGKLKLPLPDKEDDTTTPTGRSVGKLKLPLPNKEDDDTTTGRSVGKLKLPSSDKEEEDTKTRRSVGKLKIPNFFPEQTQQPRGRHAKVVPKSDIGTSTSTSSSIPTKFHEKDGDDDDGRPIVGVWAPDAGDDDFEPMEVIIHPMKSSSNLDDDEDEDDDDTTTPHGPVGIVKNAQPDKNGEYDANDLIFFPPGNKITENCHPIGIWKPLPGKLKLSYPPPLKEKSPKSVGKLRIPSLFQNDDNDNKDSKIPRRAKVVPKVDIGSSSNNIPTTFQDKDNDGSCPMIGIWAPDTSNDDDNFEPMEVIIHPTKKSLSNFDDTKPHGHVGIIKNAEPDENGNWNAKDFIFFPPGNEITDNCHPIGIWTPDKLKDEEWPPATKESKRRSVGKLQLPNMFQEDKDKGLRLPRRATSIPRSGAPPTTFKPKDGPMVGVWAPDTRTKGSGDDNDEEEDASWDPMVVLVHPKKPTNLQDYKTWGHVGILKHAEPKSNGEWDAKDIVFFPPGNDISSDCQSIGIWTPGKVNESWPPPKSPKSNKERGTVGKLKVSNLFNDEDNNDTTDPIPRRAKVVPKSSLGSSTIPRTFKVDDGPLIGVWAPDQTGTTESDDEDNWDPMYVLVHSSEPDDLIDDTTPRGIVGIKKQAEQNENGEWNAKDVIFFPPNNEISSDCRPIGIWTPGKLNETWPPSSSSSPSQRSSVGKLKSSGLPPISPTPPRSPRKVGKIPIWQTGDDWSMQSAIVYSKSNAPERNDDDTARGIWKFNKSNETPSNGNDDGINDGDEEGEPEFAPTTVRMYRKGQEPEDLDPQEPHGVWTINPTGGADEQGQWKPKDLWFFPPGQTPNQSEGIKPKGKWALPPNRRNSAWPPTPNSSAQRQSVTKRMSSPISIPKFDFWGDKVVEKTRQSVGKLKIPMTFSKLDGDDWNMQRGVVYSKNDAPERNEDDTAKGIWKFSNGEDDDESWEPTTVRMYRKGQEPEDLDPEEPNGIWGTNPKGSPNDIGEWEPKDLWFFPPGQIPDKSEVSEPTGKWTLPPNRRNSSWPPKPTSDQSSSSVHHRRAEKRMSSPVAIPTLKFWGDKSPVKTPQSVGKLKLPGQFAKLELASPTSRSSIVSPRKSVTAKLKNIPKL